MSTVQITRKVEFDAGHRIPNHESKCRNIHGHRYVLEVTIEGPVNPNRGETDDGMIVDFGNLKQILHELIVDPWDHSFLVAKSDVEMLRALDAMPASHKTVVLDDVPTAENLATLIFRRVYGYMEEHDSPCSLVKVRLYETPNCYADCVR